MTPQVTSLPTASGELPGGSVSAPAGAFYTNTDATHGTVSAGAGGSIPKTPARLIQNPRNHAEEIENAMKELGYDAAN